MQKFNQQSVLIWRSFAWLAFVITGIILILAISVFAKNAAAASVPSVITYQGKLLENGTAVTTTKSIKFVLFNSLTGGTPLYAAAGTTGAPTAVSITPSHGIFTVDLGGSGTNALDPDIFKNNSQVYLEVTIGSETLTPRKQLTSYPYAFNSIYSSTSTFAYTAQTSTYANTSTYAATAGDAGTLGGYLASAFAKLLSDETVGGKWSFTSDLNITTTSISRANITNLSVTGNSYGLKVLDMVGSSTLVYNNLSYSDPTWISSLAASKITGVVSASLISNTSSYSYLSGTSSYAYLAGTSSYANNAGRIDGFSSSDFLLTSTMQQGVTGRVAYYTADGRNVGYSNTIYISGSQMGIGTTILDSASVMSVKGNMYASTAAGAEWRWSNTGMMMRSVGGTKPSLDFNASTNDFDFRIQQAGTKGIEFISGPSSSAQVSRLKIDDTGKVGINNTSPNYTLDVGGDVNLTGALRINGSNYSQYFINSTGTAGQILSMNSSGEYVWYTLPSAATGQGVMSSTVGYFAFYEGMQGTSSTVVNGTDQLYFDSVNGRIGVGTITPAKKLDVIGDGGFSGDLSTNGNLSANGNITGGGDLILNGSGNKIVINGTNYSQYFISTSSASGTFWMSNGVGQPASWRTFTPVVSSTIGQVAYYASNGSVVTGTSTIFISGGNVGIGNTSPSYKLSVNGTVNIASGALYLNSVNASQHFIMASGTAGQVWTTLDSSGAAGWATPTGGGGGAVGTSTSGYFTVYDGITTGLESTGVTGTTFMKIDNSGNVLVNTSTAYTTSSVTTALSVYGSMYSDKIYVGNSGLYFNGDQLLSMSGNTLNIGNGLSRGINIFNSSDITVRTNNAAGTLTLWSSGYTKVTSSQKMNVDVGDDFAMYLRGTSNRIETIGTNNNIVLSASTRIFVSSTDITLQAPTTTIRGNLYVTGKYFDANNYAGAIGEYLQSTGTGTIWSSPAGSGTVGSGSAGQVAFYQSAGTTIDGTSSLYISSSGLVGVGTASPSYLLDIQGNASTNLLRVGTSSAPNILTISRTGVISATGTTINLVASSGSSTQVIVSGGLQIATQGNTQIKAVQYSNTSQAAFVSTRYGATTYWASGLSTNGYDMWTLDYYNGSALSNFLSVNSSGKLGVGVTSTTGARLTVNGDINLVTSTIGASSTLRINGIDFGQYFIDADGSYGQVWASNGSGKGYWADISTLPVAGAVGSSTAGYVAWYDTTDANVTGTDKLFIDPVTGYFGVNNTAPATRMQIKGGDDKDGGAILSFVGDVENQVEGGRIRFIENQSQGYLGAFIHYNALGDIFNIGVHNSSDSVTTSDSNAITIKRSNSYVGIGTTNPGYRLTVSGDLSYTGSLYSGSTNVGQYFITSAGSSGQIWASDGNGAGAWASTSSLGLSGSVPGGSTGQVQYNNGGIFDGASNLYWDEANGRLGVGVASPSQRLEVNGYIYTNRTAGDPGFWFRKGDAAITNLIWGAINTGVGTDYNRFSIGNNTSVSVTGFNEKLVVMNTGYVGIGTSSPGAILDVQASSTAAGTFWRFNNPSWTGGGSNQAFTIQANGTDVFSISQYGQGVFRGIGASSNFTFQNSSGLPWMTFNTSGGNGYVMVSSTSAQAIKLNTNGDSWFNGGNVGIGTSTPSYLLTVSGTTYISQDLRLMGALYDSTASAGTNGMFLQSTGTSTKWVNSPTLSSGSSLATSTAGYMAIYSGNYGDSSATVTGTSVIKINDSGYVLIGTSTPYKNGTTSTVTIAGALYADHIFTSGNSLYMNGQKIVGSDASALNFYASNNQNMQLQTLGNGQIQLNSAGNLVLAASSSMNVYTDSGTLNVEAKGVAGSLTLKGGNSIFLMAPNLYLNSGKLYDAASFEGAMGNVLISTGTSTRWVSTNTLGFLSSYTETDPIWTSASSSYYTTSSADARFQAKFTTLSVVNGGTGSSTLLSNGILTGNGINPVGAITPSNGYLYWSGSDYSWIVNPSGGSGTGINTSTAGFMTYYLTSNTVTGTSAMYVSSNMIGIGTTSPSQLLTIDGNMRLTGLLYDSTNASGTPGQVLSATTNGTQWITMASGGSSVGSAGYIQFASSTAGAFNATSGLFWDNTNGRFGISTTTPSTLLQVGTNFYTGSTSSVSDGNLENVYSLTRSSRDINFNCTDWSTYANTINDLTVRNKFVSGAERYISSYNLADSAPTANSTAGTQRIYGQINEARASGSYNHGTLVGANNSVLLARNSGGTIVTSTIGLINNIVSANSSGTTTILTAVGEQISMNRYNAGNTNIINANGMVVYRPFTYAGNFNVTNWTALRLNAHLSGTDANITNEYALYVDQGNSYFGGNVGIGTTTPNSSLQVVGNINATTFNNATLSEITTAGEQNLDIGYQAGGTFVSGMHQNTFIGYQSGTGGTHTNATDSNTAVGHVTLNKLTTGGGNNAFGIQAGYNITTGGNNTAIGENALYSNQTTNSNTALGGSALFLLTGGGDNVSVGRESMSNVAYGKSNVAVGRYAGTYYGLTGTFNTIASSSNGIYIGHRARAMADAQTNEIVLGYEATGNGSNSVTLGNSSNLKTILTGNVGIGTTTPAYKLDIWGNTTGLQTGLNITDYGANNPAIELRDTDSAGVPFIDFTNGSTGTNAPDYGGRIAYNWSSGALNGFSFNTNGSSIPRMVIGSIGNVGIGTTTPAAKLTILSTATNDIFSTYTSTTQPALYVANNGYVGIGTTTPISSLTVSSSAAGSSIISMGSLTGGGGGVGLITNQVPTTAGQRLGGFFFGAVTNSNYGAGIFGWTAEPWTLGSNQGSYFTFETTPVGSATRAERMRITSNGNVGIGITSPSYNLAVSGTIGIANTTNANKGGVIYKGSNTFLHDFTYGYNGTLTPVGENTFLGENAGNLTLGSGATSNIYQSSYNTGIGYMANNKLTTGSANTIVGAQSGMAITSGGNNTVVGVNSFASSQTTNSNAILGDNILNFMTSGGNNVSIGRESMVNVVTANYNVVLGRYAGSYYGPTSSAPTITQATRNIYIGASSRSLADNQSDEVVIGYSAIGNGSNSVTLGNSSNLKTILTGNVGIGTTTPISPLTVSSTGNITPVFVSGDVNNYMQFNIKNNNAGASASADYVATANNGTETSNYIDMGINNSAYSVGTWTINGANDGYLYTSDGDLSIGTASTSKYLSFFTGGTLAANERMRVDGNGYVGIGTTSPAYLLHIASSTNSSVSNVIENGSNGSSAFTFLGVYNDGGFSTRAGVLRNSSVNTNYSSAGGLNLFTYANNPVGIITSNTLRMVVSGSGNVGIGTSSPAYNLTVSGTVQISSLNTNGTVYSNGGVLTNTDPSDINLKENIRDLDSNVLSKVMNLRPVVFNWKSNSTESHGFIAQEVEEVFPDLVSVGVNGYKGLYTTQFIPYLVKAIQQQQTQIQSFAALENNNQLVSSTVAGDLSISGNAKVIKNLEVKGHSYFGEDSIGQAKILAGAVSSHIEFENDYSNPPIITVTPLDFVGAEYRVATTTVSGFDILLASSTDHDVAFNWHAFATGKLKVFISDGRIEIVYDNPNAGNGEVSGNSVLPSYVNPQNTDPSVGPVGGCTNYLAENFNPNATDDDGSCIVLSSPATPTETTTTNNILTDVDATTPVSTESNTSTQG